MVLTPQRVFEVRWSLAIFLYALLSFAQVAVEESDDPFDFGSLAFAEDDSWFCLVWALFGPVFVFAPTGSACGIPASCACGGGAVRAGAAGNNTRTAVAWWKGGRL